MDWQTLDFLFPVLFSKLGEVPRDFLQDILPAKEKEGLANIRLPLPSTHNTDAAI